ncbi:MAG: hypothetical protein DI539_05110 [Flavobacterium psychrophilum]|nr:MAG: hypothetical protein DI539_05110 [Flavobacterium psychrophilum]
MDSNVITAFSEEIPDFPNLEAIDGELLLEHIISHLGQDKFALFKHHYGIASPIEGYKKPLDKSELILHINLHDKEIAMEGISNELLANYIRHNKIKVVEAVRHASGPFTRIVANLDSQN